MCVLHGVSVCWQRHVEHLPVYHNDSYSAADVLIFFWLCHFCLDILKLRKVYFIFPICKCACTIRNDCVWTLNAIFFQHEVFQESLESQLVDTNLKSLSLGNLQKSFDCKLNSEKVLDLLWYLHALREVKGEKGKREEDLVDVLCYQLQQ